MDLRFAIVLMAGGAALVLALSISMRMTGKRDWGSPFNFFGSLGRWTPPETPEDEWQKWGKN